MTLNVSNTPHHALRDQGILFYGESVHLLPNKMAKYHGIVGDLKCSTFLGHKISIATFKNVFIETS